MRWKGRQLLAIRPYGVVIVVLAIAFGAYLYLWPDAPYATHDTPGYVAAAHDLADGRIDALQDRTPGYPLLLLISGAPNGEARALFVVQLAMHFAAVVILLLAMQRFGVDRRLQLAFVLIGIAPPFVAHTAYAGTETMTELALVAATVLVVGWAERGRGTGVALAAGIAIAVAAVTRPTYCAFGIVAGLLVLVFGPALLGLRRRRIIPAAVAIAAPASIAVGGLIAYNATQFGYPGLTPLAGFNLSTKTAGLVENLPDEYADVRAVLVRHRDAELTMPHSTHTARMYIWDAIPDLRRTTGFDEGQLSQLMMRLNLGLIAESPRTYAEDVARATATYWMPETSPRPFTASTSSQLIWSVVGAFVLASFGVVMLMMIGLALIARLAGASGVAVAVRSAVEESRGSTFGLLFSFAVVFYTMAVSVLVEVGYPRYRVPTDLLIVFASAVGAAVVGHLRPLIAGAAFPHDSAASGGSRVQPIRRNVPGIGRPVWTAALSRGIVGVIIPV